MYPQKLVQIIRIIPKDDLVLDLGEIVKKAMFDMQYGSLRAQGDILYISDVIRRTPDMSKLRGTDILGAYSIYKE